jgi:signal transduction histidine kinase/DNA-binding response OmpR family regulator
MTPNQLFALVVEAVFTLVFIGAIADYRRGRDPVSRGVALTFSPFVGLLLVSLWRAGFGAPPAALSLASAVLLLAQPLFALHLVSLIRPVPRWILIGAVGLLVLSIALVYVFRGAGPVVTLAVLAAFASVELLSAGYLAVEARRRRGPGGTRLWIAAASTVALAAGLLATSFGLLGPSVTAVAVTVALALTLVSGAGYLIAFVPPSAVRKLWQAGAAVTYQRALLERSGASVDEIWAGFAHLAAELTGSTVAVIEYRRDGSAAVAATDGLDAAALAAVSTATDTAPADDPTARRRGSESEVPVASFSEDDPARRVGRAAGALFVSLVPIGEDGWARRSLVIASTHRSLFHASDLDLLATLGTQTGILAERRAMHAEQEALAARLSESVEAARAANRAKSDFLASMSHELRTPLSAILGFSDLMRHEPAVDESVTVPLEWVEHVHRGGEHLLALVNDVLDLSKVEAGRMELRYESYDLASAIAELVNGVRPLADRKDLTLVVDAAPLTLVADRGRIRQVLYNLVSNAIKFTPSGGRVTISAAEAADGVRLTVADTGVGIAPEELPLIFDEFKQVGLAKDREGGTGLGLALAQRLVQAHGGSLEVESTVGAGTTFTVILPRRSEAAGRTAASSRAATSATADAVARDILVIEDDPSAVPLLREYLEPVGYTVRVAADGEQGLAMAAERRPVAILLDVLIPRVDGWEVLRQLKADAQMRDIPVVMVTIVDERDVGLALGAVDYLVKPVQRGALLACLERIGLTPAAIDRPPRILAVDDEPAALQLVEGYLAGSGFDVIPATSGREALDLVQEHDIDLVICDLMMPDIDGFGVVARLKADARTAPIPILICTAKDLTSDDKERLHGQILGIVSKGPSARDGLRGWLAQLGPLAGSASA